MRFDNAAKRKRIVRLLFNLYCWLAENHTRRMEKKYIKYILDRGCIPYEVLDNYIQRKDKMSPEQIRTIKNHLSSCQFCKKDMEIDMEIARSLEAMKEK
ncbi:MAG TPA: hypothetical protein DHV62_01285 [Elusimicrobia bacterium]|nr:hypothetical protein [Elusimicrobiota bacterium]